MIADTLPARETVEFVAQLAVEWTIRGSAVLLAGALLARLCIHRSSAMKHRIWLATLVAFAALPIASLNLPEWKVLPRFPSQVTSSPVKTGITQPPRSAPSRTTAPV